MSEAASITLDGLITSHKQTVHGDLTQIRVVSFERPGELPDPRAVASNPAIRFPFLSNRRRHRTKRRNAMPSVSPKIQGSLESKARRLARRCGLRATKSRRMLSIDNFGEFMLIDTTTNFVVAGARFDWTTADVIEHCQKMLEVEL